MVPPSPLRHSQFTSLSQPQSTTTDTTCPSLHNLSKDYLPFPKPTMRLVTLLAIAVLLANAIPSSNTLEGSSTLKSTENSASTRPTDDLPTDRFVVVGGVEFNIDREWRCVRSCKPCDAELPRAEVLQCISAFFECNRRCLRWNPFLNGGDEL